MTSTDDNPLLQDIAFAWQQAEQNFREGHRAESLVTQIHCALVYSTILTQQNDQPEDDITQQALVFTRIVPYFSSRYEVVLEIFNFLLKEQLSQREMIQQGLLFDLVPHLRSPEREIVIEGALNAPSKRSFHRSYLLRRLGKYLTPTQIAQIFSDIPDIQWVDNRSMLLGDIAPYLPSELMAKAWEIAQTTTNHSNLSSGIGIVAKYLPPDQWDEAFSFLLAMPQERNRARALGEIIDRLSPSERERVLENAFTIQDPHRRRFLLDKVISTLSEERRLTLYKYLATLPDQTSFEELFPKLAPKLPVAWIPKALTRMESLDYDFYTRRHVLVMIASRMEGEFKQQLLRQALELGYEEEDDIDRAEAFTTLIECVDDGEIRAEILTLALTAIEHLEPEDKGDFLVELCSILRDKEFVAILETITSIQPPNNQTHVVSKTAYKLPDSLLPKGMELVRVHKEHLWYGHDCEQLGSTLSAWAKRNPDVAYEEWKANLHAFAELPRVQLLTFLANMLPFVMSLAADEAPQTAEGIYRVVQEICTRYP
jgi:hypothetical protein